MTVNTLVKSSHSSNASQWATQRRQDTKIETTGAHESVARRKPSTEINHGLSKNLMRGSEARPGTLTVKVPARFETRSADVRATIRAEQTRGRDEPRGLDGRRDDPRRANARARRATRTGRETRRSAQSKRAGATRTRGADARRDGARAGARAGTLTVQARARFRSAQDGRADQTRDARRDGAHGANARGDEPRGADTQNRHARDPATSVSGCPAPPGSRVGQPKQKRGLPAL